ncbi:hypothetical protein DV737_g5162, partial [Chaetothyriales sp. CBS 132003]
MSLADALPPSPPTTSSRKERVNLPSALPLRSTPEDSTASAHDDSSLGSRKRVGFHPFANVHHSSDPASSNQQPLEVKRLPPSRECQSSNRPILKVKAQWEQEVGEMDGPACATASLHEAVGSAVQQLCSDDKTAVVDAYQALASAMRAYDELPDAAVMKSKLNSLTRHIRTHLATSHNSSPSPVDSSLVTSALKVAVILVWSPDISPLLHDDFKLFLADRAIQVIVDHAAPKNIVMHYLHLLATQDFRPWIMGSNQRAARLIDALGTLGEHYKGNGPASERLMVYAKLIDQARSVMKAKAAVWIEPMLQGMCSVIPALRIKALGLGRKACQAFAPTNSICSHMRYALEAKHQAGAANSVCVKLEKLISNKDTETALVPQIWAVVLLLANHPVTPIEKWPQLKEWLVVIQRCFNGSDPALRQQAYLAWNRFVFIARPHEASESLMAMLVKPIIAQLERPREKASKGSHALAVSTYCNLLYYAFRPATSHSQCTKSWNEYIVKVLRPSLFEKSAANADIASRILMALLWDARTATKVWKENRAHENRSVEPEELPTIDCKWIRRKCEGVTSIFEVLFTHSSWGLPGSSDQAFISKAWRHFLRAIRDAGSKEIKMSEDMRSATTAIMGLVARLWAPSHVGDAEGEGRDDRLSDHALHTLTRLTVAELGPTSMLELLDQSPHSRHCPLLCQILTTLFQEQATRAPATEEDVAEPLKKCLKVMGNSLVLAEGKGQSSGPNGLIWEARELCQVLESLPRQSVLPCLALLSPCLSSWLRDEGKCLPDKATLQDVCVCAFKVLETVSPSCVADLDDVFAAAFSSTHSTTVHAAATLWNTYFGHSPNLKIGPQLQQAISRLRPHVELEMPFMIGGDRGDGEEDEEAVSLPVDETQAPPSPQVRAEGATTVNRVEEVVTLGTDETDESKQQATDTAEDSARNRRQDGSQIDFITVESSPLGHEFNSRLLTERQEEVLERQRPEPAVVFADLRSSPRPRSSRSQSRDCEFARKAASMAERPATPTLPDAHDAGDVDAVPSPTPKARSLRGIEEADIPSSPPSMQGRNTEQSEAVHDMPWPAAGASGFKHHHQLFLDSLTKEDDDGTGKRAKERAQSSADSPMQIDDESPGALDEKDGEDVGAVMVGAEPNEVSLEGIIAEPAQASRAQTPSSQITSDELEEMSASQLTHDLEWSQVIDSASEQASRGGEGTEGPAMQSPALDGEKVTLDEANAEGCNESTATVETSPGSGGLGKRKRAATGSEDKGRRRRRRKMGSQGQSQPALTQGSSHQRDADAEIYDEIVAWSSSPGPTSPAGRNGLPTGPSSGPGLQKRAGRRQRRRIGLPRSREPEPVDASSDEASKASLLLEPSQAEASAQPVAEGQRDTGVQTADVGQADGRAVLASAHADLVSSLRHSLELAKSAVKGGFSLRAVADLCFEIQHIATLRAGSGHAGTE